MPDSARIDWRNLPPIDPAEREPALARLAETRAVSVTFLGKHDVCDRSAYLYAKHRGGAGGHQLNRGSLFHETVAELTRELQARNENDVPPEIAKDRLLEVSRRHLELATPAYERDQLRGMLHNWAVGSYFWPERIVGVELDLQLEIAGWLVRGRVDLIEQPADDMLDVTDYKTQWDMPKTSESGEWARGGFDEHGNPRFGGNFQTQLYALLAAFGTTPDGLTIGDGIERFRVFLRFPRFLREEGLAYREAEIDRRQLVDFRLDLETQLARLDAQMESGRFQPTPGSHCGYCPAEYECPLPRHLRPDSQFARLASDMPVPKAISGRPAEVLTYIAECEALLDELARAGATWGFMAKRATQLKSRIRKTASALDLRVVPVGADVGLRFAHREGEKIADKEELRIAVEGAVEYGHPFSWADHIIASQWTEFDKRKIDPEEGDL